MRYEQGCTNYRLLPLLDIGLLLAGTEGSEHGLAVEYFNNDDLTALPSIEEMKTTSEMMWFGEMPEGVDPQQFSFRATGRFTPAGDGTLHFWTGQRGPQPPVYRWARGDR